METVRQLVKHLNFSTKGKDVYSFEFHNNGAKMQADMQAGTFIYPEAQGLVVANRQTCNFTSPENLVVFECVFRLLQIGYSPDDIVIEPSWKVGHGASGGRADILLKDRDGNAFLIIECKTYGRAFEDEWRYMNNDGGQLFTYARQTDGAAKHVVLYASALDDGNLKREYKLISLRDRGGYVGDNALFLAWKELYKQEFETHGVFEDNCEPFEIGKKKRAIKDLQELSHNDIQKKYNEFATILRKYNVSGRENAFDKLVNLFLAKIVDEANNPDDLQFAWKVAADDYYKMIDRIQRLYRDGMQKFLNEEVTYIENKAIDDAFYLFKNDPDATRDTIMSYFKKLKYYTNNDFALIDVYNESLFYKNAEILKEIVVMLQDIKLKTDEQNQFLGDLFEGFLDQGVKQSEGQFFTPMPIVKFLVSSLPLEHLATSNGDSLRVIDYACGAGHFLNEYASQICKFVSSDQLPGYYGNIFGIEKEYRLSKVAKVSAFMYGQEDINTVYGDALSHNEKIEDGSFDVLISNPPYSVKGFLETLSEETRNAFEISSVIDSKSISKNKGIEAFFVERAKQLLAPGGVAAIILPSSILSTEDAVYTKAREIILQHFDTVAIAEFGGGTFGKTGTNTVTLFLRRKVKNPSLAQHYSNRVAHWFSGGMGKEDVFEDAYMLESYCSNIGVELEAYKTLLESKPSEILLETDIFKEYKTAFGKQAKVKNRKNQKTFKAMSEEEQKEEMYENFTKYARTIEMDKLYYFMLAHSNPQDVVVVKCPAKDADMKKYLGYEWSTRKGDEGIKYLGVLHAEDADEGEKAFSRLTGIKSIQTPLFDPADLMASDKINAIIRNNFSGVTDGDSEFVKRYQLVDMLDFSGVKFSKVISLSAEQAVEISSKYPLVTLGSKCHVRIGGTPRRANNAYYQNGNNLWVSIKEMSGQVIVDTKEKITDIAVKESNCKLIPKGTTLLSFKLSIGKVAVAGAALYTNEAIAGLIPRDKDEILDAYLFHLFDSKMIELDRRGYNVFGKSLNSNYLKERVKIPLPPIDIQRKIIDACDMISEEHNRIRMTIHGYHNSIEQLFKSMETAPGTGYNLNNTTTFNISIGKRVTAQQLIPNGTIPVYSANVFTPFGYINERLINDFSIPSVLWGIDGDWMVNYMPADIPFYPTDHCGVLRMDTDKINPRIFAWYLEQEGKRLGFSRSHRASTERIKRITISLPAIDVQNKTAMKVLKLEAKIEKEKQRLEGFDIKKKEILQRFLGYIE